MTRERCDEVLLAAIGRPERFQVSGGRVTLQLVVRPQDTSEFITALGMNIERVQA